MKRIIFLLLFPLFSFSQTQIGQDINGDAFGDQSGTSVSLSSDGTIVAIGAPHYSAATPNSGSVNVYENISGVWTQVGETIDGETHIDRSGWSVSLSSDGSIVAIGSPFKFTSIGGARSGHVRVFENISGVWTQVGSAINGEVIQDRSGSAVSLSSDGSIVAIGALENFGNIPYRGNVRIFKNISGDWTQIGSTIYGEAAGDYLGFSISLSSDGSVVAIGAPEKIIYSGRLGYVKIYKNISGDWIQVGNKINGEQGNSESGSAVSLSSDGSIVAIGAPKDAINGPSGNYYGRVRVYENVSGIWTQLGEDIIGSSSFGRSGSSVSLSSDGSIVAIGAPTNNNNGLASGQVRIYKNVSGVWTQIGENINGENPRDESGSSVSLSSNSSVIAIGARFNDGDANEGTGSAHGHVRVYDLTEALSINENNYIDFNLYPNPTNTSFTIELPEELQLKKVSIYNNFGQLVKTSTLKQIVTTDLSSGVYIVEIETNKGKATKKLIIE